MKRLPHLLAILAAVLLLPSLILLTLLVGCQGEPAHKPEKVAKPSKSTEDENNTIAPTSPTPDATSQKIRSLLKPWHKVNKEWTTNSSVIFSGVYHHGSYPGIYFDNGDRVTPARSYFVVEKKLKGKINRKEAALRKLNDE